MPPHEADRPVDLDDPCFGLDCAHLAEAFEKGAHDIEVEMSADERDVFHRLFGVAGDLCDLRARVHAAIVGSSGRAGPRPTGRDAAGDHAVCKVARKPGVIVLDLGAGVPKPELRREERDAGKPIVRIGCAKSAPKRPVIAMAGGDAIGIGALGRRAGEDKETAGEGFGAHAATPISTAASG